MGNEGIDVLLLQTTIEITLEHLSTHDVVPKVQRYVQSQKWNVIHPYTHVIDFEWTVTSFYSILLTFPR